MVMSVSMFVKRVAAAALSAVVLGTSAAPNVYAASGDSDETYTVHSGPNLSSETVYTASRGETVTVQCSVGGGWLRVCTADGVLGYCPSDELRAVPVEEAVGGNAPVSQTVTTRAAANLYAGPDASSAVLALLPAHLEVEPVQENGGFVLVGTSSGLRGYVRDSLLDRADAYPASFCTRPKLTAGGAVTEEEAQARLEALSEYFLDGLYWNHYPDANALPADTLFDLTATPCSHIQNGEVYCNVYADAPETLISECGTLNQCMGYCALLSDLVFGTDAPIRVHRDLDQIRVGDHLRLRDYEHSMLVTAIRRGRDGALKYSITEVNRDYETCEIDWDRTVTIRELLALGDDIRVFTRYPETED